MYILPTVLLASTAIISSIPSNMNTNYTDAASTKQYKNVIVKQIGANGTLDLNSELKKLGISISCPNVTPPQIIKPNCNKPGINKPENNKPENNKPENNKPENNKPENNKPENNKPENNKPENNKPENNKPENNKPEQDNSQSSFASQVVTLVNAERAKAGLTALTVDTNVTKAANVRAKEIVSSFSHTRPNGSSFSTALTESGAKFKGSGENIAWGQTSPEAVMKAWMNSDGHRANILNKNYTSIGIGHYQDASGRDYWTQLFTY